MAEKKIWITGASRGIGAEVARQLARAGWTVAVSARSDDELAELVGEANALNGEIHAYPLDITDAEACVRVFADIEGAHGPLDTVLLNAGTHEPIDGTAFSVEPVRKLVEINLMGTVHCLAPVIERFVARTSGKIAVVSSVAGYRGLPTSSGYGATKAGLINMCEALRPELEMAGVTICCVTPGFVRTPLTDKNPFPMPFLMEVEDAAARIVRGLERDAFEITFPRRFTYMLKVLRMLPYALYFALTRRIVPKDGETS
ncbi:MAG: SDR family NAD(P)-dependent oxidoreductase [Alphaproteobacteria bacterium]|nr:SDR family NAD(P)-dependent oxidoreductase [Alphaproteobacteria bacterium]